MPPGSIIPGARNRQDSLAGLLAGTADDRIVPAKLGSVITQGPEEIDGAVASRNFKGYRAAHDEASRRKPPGVIVPELKQGVLRVTVPSSPKLPSELGVL